MNRELKLKFRVWDKHHKQWYKTGVAINLDGTVYDLCEESSDQNCLVQSFTGLYDNNGKEIYEGDILKCKGYERLFDMEEFYYNREVEHIIVSTGLFDMSGYFNIPVDREVIGNIFENPELLN